MKFRIKTAGYDLKHMKETWYDGKLKNLPSIFTLDQIPENSFPKNIMEELRNIKEDNISIELHYGSFHWAGIVSIDEKDRKIKSDHLKFLQKEYKILEKSVEVKRYFELETLIREMKNKLGKT